MAMTERSGKGGRPGGKPSSGRSGARGGGGARSAGPRGGGPSSRSASRSDSSPRSGGGSKRPAQRPARPPSSTPATPQPLSPGQRPRRPGLQQPRPAPIPPIVREIELDLAVTPAAPTEDFFDLAGSFGIEFEPGDAEKLGLYLAMLMRANESFNLTAVKDQAEAWTRHIFDSLTLLPVLAELPENGLVIDVGSGGGLPGLPLAICSPQLRFTLLEATGKKAEFLRRAVEQLGLTNVRIAQERAERAGHDRGDKVSTGGTTARQGGLREAYDLAVARAVGPLATIAELTVPFVKVGGRAALIKGQKADEELAQAGPALHLLKAVHAATVDTPTGRIVILEKSSATPRMYPRPDGEPKRKPLGL